MWITPKTNWYGSRDSNNVYTGDRFNAADFNRLKNNLVHLRTLAVQLYSEFTLSAMGDDKTVSDYFYADEINLIESNLNTINSNTVNDEYGDTPTYVENGNVIDFEELNRLESAMLDMFNKLTNQFNGRRKLTWNFGIKEEF